MKNCSLLYFFLFIIVGCTKQQDHFVMIGVQNLASYPIENTLVRSLIDKGKEVLGEFQQCGTGISALPPGKYTLKVELQNGSLAVRFKKD